MNEVADVQHAVLVPGGGLLPDGGLPPWMRQRLERALSEPGEPLIVLLSGGTVHKPPPLDAEGFPIFESKAAARYLLSRGADPARLATETSSYDTIGNAYFGRFDHVEPLGLERVTIVTSQFHAKRTEAIFRWIFGLTPSPVTSLHVVAVPTVGMSAEQLDGRLRREAQSLSGLQELIDRIDTIPKLHHWMFHEHEAYAAHLTPRRATHPDVLDSY